VVPRGAAVIYMCCRVQGYLAHKRSPSPLVHHMALGTGLLQGPGGSFPLQLVTYPCKIAHKKTSTPWHHRSPNNFRNLKDLKRGQWAVNPLIHASDRDP